MKTSRPLRALLAPAASLQALFPRGATIRAEQPGTTVITTSIKEGELRTCCLFFDGKSNITLDGLIIDGDHIASGIYVGGDNLRVLNKRNQVRLGGTGSVASL